MNSQRPYLVRAIYEWIVDNNCTPHIIVAADKKGVVVPREHVKDGRIVLNISPTAVRGLVIGNVDIVFSGRFSGSPMELFIPLSAVLGIYARENGQGMVFEDLGPEDPEPSDEGPGEAPEDKPKKPALRVVK